MPTPATTYPAPLCACCEHALADINADGVVLRCEHLGPICQGCRPFVVAASWALARVGLRECAPLGPGLAKGGLGACMALATALPDPAEADFWTAFGEHGPALAWLVLFLGSLMLLYGWLQRRAGREDAHLDAQRLSELDIQQAHERGMVEGYREAVVLLRAEGFLGAEKLPGNLPAALEQRGGRQ